MVKTNKKPLFVTQPFLPDISEYMRLLEGVWDSHIITNGGELHDRLENQLSNLFRLESVSLINNGTIALQIALQALNIKGRVITTPFSFVATANAIKLAGLEPVFIDIGEDSFNLDPELIGEACDEETGAVMPVHVYGFPCACDTIDKKAGSHNLKVIYDAAHAFNPSRDGAELLARGDCSVLSFHATKVFHTFEGGAIVSRDPDLSPKIARLRNFGYDHGEIEVCGTNGKMNEAQAAMGLLMLEHLQKIIKKRKFWHDTYCRELADVEGLNLPKVPENWEHNYAYFPVLLNEAFPVTRDELYEDFIKHSIYTRKYFHPLITDFALYKGYRVISKHKVPNARKIADSVICLPLFSDMTESDIERVCDFIKKVAKTC